MWHSFHPVYSSPKIYPVAARFNSTHTCSVSQKLSLSHICSAYTTLTYNRCVCVNNDAHTSCSRPYWQKFYFMINFFEDQAYVSYGYTNMHANTSKYDSCYQIKYV